MAMKEQTPKRKTKILVVDDHPIVRYGISRILNKEEDLAVCGEAEDGNEALLAIEKHKPDLILMDISLKRYDGLKLTRIIRTDYPDIPVLILSMHDESVYARKALRCGAKGYIMKEESSEKLVSAIRQVLRGDIYVSDNVNKNVLTDFAGPAGKQDKSLVDALSDRERQIFILLGQGHSSRAIADKLLLSVKTVETHRSRIKLKLAMESNQQLLVTAAEWAAKEGLKPALIV
jgi:DNA-binding NarL/FixJ family response regulator